MDRSTALKLTQEKVKTKNIRKHLLACEVVMAALTRRFGEDEGIWALAGLVHDLDYDLTLDDPEQHARIAAEWLRQHSVTEPVVQSVLAHADKAEAGGSMDIALQAVDPLTGFLVACALMTPDKKLASTTPDFALRRFKEKGFARGASRERMLRSQELGLGLEEFIDLGLGAMRGIAGELGL